MPDLLQPARPADVRGLVEARLQLDRHGHLLAVARRVDQVLQDLRVRRGPVERHLDRPPPWGPGSPRARSAPPMWRRIRKESEAGPVRHCESGEICCGVSCSLDVGDRMVVRVVQARNGRWPASSIRSRMPRSDVGLVRRRPSSSSPSSAASIPRCKGSTCPGRPSAAARRARTCGRAARSRSCSEEVVGLVLLAAPCWRCA